MIAVQECVFVVVCEWWSDVWVWEVTLTADCPDGALTKGLRDGKLPHLSHLILPFSWQPTFS